MTDNEIQLNIPNSASPIQQSKPIYSSNELPSGGKDMRGVSGSSTFLYYIKKARPNDVLCGTSPSEPLTGNWEAVAVVINRLLALLHIAIMLGLFFGMVFPLMINY